MIRFFPSPAFFAKNGQIFQFRRFCSKKMRERSANDLKKSIERRLRDKKFEAILLEEEREKMTTESKSESENSGTSENLDSIFAQRYFKQNVQKFAVDYSDVINNLKKKENLAKKLPKNNTPNNPTDISYPYDHITHVEHKETSENHTDKKKKPVLSPDRGFYVVQDTFRDDYLVGSALDLPQEKQFSLISENPSKKQVPETFRKRIGGSDAVEEIEFQHPHQFVRQGTHAETDYEKDWTLRYGAADPTVPPADKNCPACGARFHCQNTGLPGFLPVEYFQERQNEDFKGDICRRCFLLKHHNFLLNVNVSKANYEKMLSRLRNMHEILIILIVDLLDFPCSIYRDLPRLVGVGKHVIIVGNKVDLIPPDNNDDYLKHYTKCLKQSVTEFGFDKELNILSISLISAKTGYGIEKLISRIYRYWGNKGDVYLVGCTNSGKSTLFNTLLQSDLCKVRASDLVERATTSIWPGTTINLLKFPVMNPTPARLSQRENRLKMVDRMLEDEDKHRMMLFRETGDKKYAVLQGYIGQTFENPDDMIDMEKLESVRTNRHFMPPIETKKTKISLDTCIEFKHGVWCYDTPGTVNSDQIINMLTLEELTKTIPGSLITPRTVILTKNKSLLIGGLARVDFMGPTPTSQILLTVFASEKLPIHVMDRRDVSKFYSKYVGTKILEVPCGGDQRLNNFPQLCHKDIFLEGVGNEESCADVLLSSVGWVAVTGYRRHRIELKAWTPNGVGIFVRQPALLPFAVGQRGEKILGTSEYQVLPLNS